MHETQLPDDFVQRLKEIYPSDGDAVLKTFETARPCTFRVNTIKTSTIELLQKLTDQGFEVHEFTPLKAFILDNKTQRELTETEEYNNGLFYIQGLSSMIPPTVLNPRPGDTVLDACSAPGSKTTQMAALMENTGQIIANDMSRVRLYKLAANIKTLGVTNVTTMHMRAQDLWRKFPNTFDKVLADVPCSLEGRFLTTNPKTFSNWSVKKIKILSDHQKHILRSAISSAAPGATIVYSTCTLSPEENEEVVDWILKKDPSVSLQNISLDGLSGVPAIMEWKGKTYDPSVAKCLRLQPSSEIEGFFIALFEKR